MAQRIRFMMCASALALLAACASPTMAPSGPGATGQTAAGNVLVDAKGMTLYTYDPDQPGKSNCTGLCATFWPPVEAADGATPNGDFTIITRGSGAKQWAYKGKPLYTYYEDSKPGDISGDGDDGVWHVAKP
jgi:predicted lipoprotein with Yx(FWY)xxD motif